MSAADLDLTEAVEAAARELLASEQRTYVHPLEWENLALISQHNMREAVLPTVAAAAPVIAAQVRERLVIEIARTIALHVARDPDRSDLDPGLVEAARIVRGFAS